jgi:hypothetical protein
MPYDPEKHRRRKQEVARRAAVEDSMYSYCRIIGCHKPTTAASKSGLNRLYCRGHEDHFERHGSHLHASYTAAELAPHRKVARVWLREHKSDREVTLAVRAVERLYRNAGPVIEAFRLRGLSPKDRANAVWARLRDNEVDPLCVLEVWLAVEGTINSDKAPDRHAAFKQVQAAKVLHRMAGGSHRRWERTTASGRRVVEEMHTYPASRGRVLRHIGEQIEKATELVSGATKG